MEFSERISIINIPPELINRKTGVRISAEERDFFLLSEAFTPVMGLTQPPLELVAGCILIICLCIFYSYCMFMYLHSASWHSSATLTGVFPCFFLTCKANARVKTRKDRARPALLQNLCCSMYCLFCVVLCVVCV